VKRKVIIFTCISLCLSSFQVTNNQSAVAAICSGLGAAAYPPDLPDCLDPVVAAQQAADLEVSVRASAAASASRAAQDAAAAQAIVEARLANEAREAARLKALEEEVAAAAFVAKAQQAGRAAALAAARAAQESATAVAAAARAAQEIATAVAAAALIAQESATATRLAAAKALSDSQTAIATAIATARAEASALIATVVANKKLKDDADKNVIDARAAANTDAAAANLARELYVAAGGTPPSSLRMADPQIIAKSLTIKKQVLLTQAYPQSNLKIQSNSVPVFATAEELALAARLTAWNLAKATAEISAGVLANKIADANSAEIEWKRTAGLKAAAEARALAAAALRTRLETELREKEAAALAAELAATAATAELARKEAALTVANNAKNTWDEVESAVSSAADGGAGFETVINAQITAINSVVAAAKAASSAADAAADAAADESAAAAELIRIRNELERAARNPTYSGPSVGSLELAAEAAEKAAKEAEEKAKAAKDAEEKALAAKKAAEEAAASAKLAADKAAADLLAKEKAKRAAARKKIEAERSKATDAINKVQDDAQQNAENIDKSDTDINLAYKKAVDELAKVDKNLALLREKENKALKALDQTRQELISVSQELKTAENKKDDSIAKLVQASINQAKIESQIKSSQATLVETEKKIVLAEKVLAETTVKYEKTLAIEKSAIAKATESKRAADDAYSIWQASLNSPRLVTSNLKSSQPLVDESQSANAQSATSKLKELYDNAQRRYDQDKAIADKASADVALAKQAVDTAKRTVASQQLLKKNLQTSISKLGTELTEAKKITKSAIDEKNAAVRSYSAAESKIASIKTKLTQSEIDYDSAQAETKYTYENYSSQTRQVSALKKLSDFSKDSVENMKDVISSIQDEANNLRDLKIVNFLNDNEKLSKVALPIFVLTFTAVTSGIVYALLRRRRKNPKAYTVDPEIDEFLEIHRKKQERSAKRAVKKKSLKVSKTKSASTKKKPKSTK
jgi:hypothetical protein